jgi:hypothetical protein
VELLQGHILTLLHLAFGAPSFGVSTPSGSISVFGFMTTKRPCCSTATKSPSRMFEVVKNFAWDNDLTALANASDSLLGGGCFTCHAFRLSDSLPNT